MKIIVNDIENIVQLHKMGAFCDSCNVFESILLTSIIKESYSINYQRNFTQLFDCGLKIVDVDIELFMFKEKHKKLFRSLGIGDVSSIYYAFTTNDVYVLTTNIEVVNICNQLSINVIGYKDFLKSFIKDDNKVKKIFKLKIA